VTVRVTTVPTESVTETVKVLVPAEVAVPLMTPVEAFKENPAGRLPEVTANL
jgi:hypothetical protein